MRVIVDPGHGGEDNGATYADKLGYVEEDDTNLSIGLYLDLMLQVQRLDSSMTRDRDITTPLAERVTIANNLNVDAFVSIHCDAFHDNTVSGMTVHIALDAKEADEKLANGIMSELMFQFPTHKARGVKRSNFYVLRNTEMPAVLVECEFLSNPDTMKFLREPENQYALAQAISKGIIKTR